MPRPAGDEPDNPARRIESVVVFFFPFFLLCRAVRLCLFGGFFAFSGFSLVSFRRFPRPALVVAVQQHEDNAEHHDRNRDWKKVAHIVGVPGVALLMVMVPAGMK